MPFNAGTIASIVVFAAAIAVYWRTKKLGATVGIVFAGFVVLAAANPSFLQKGANLIGKILDWIISQAHF